MKVRKEKNPCVFGDRTVFQEDWAQCVPFMEQQKTLNEHTSSFVAGVKHCYSTSTLLSRGRGPRSLDGWLTGSAFWLSYFTIPPYVFQTDCQFAYVREEVQAPY